MNKLVALMLLLSPSMTPAAGSTAWERVERFDETSQKRIVGFVLKGESVELSVACMPIPVVAFTFSGPDDGSSYLLNSNCNRPAPGLLAMPTRIVFVTDKLVKTRDLPFR